MTLHELLSSQQQGIARVETKFYPSARHEILNETNKAEVHRDVIEWLEQHR